tara:strand:- start:180 stop:767 length:588 start_codon:yes stop_codon:yes gene_type:complete
MRMVQRKQDSMSDAFLFSLMQKQLEEEGEIDEIRMDVVKAPIIQGDETLSNLASRIVDEVKVVAPKSLANKVLQQAGIDTSLESAQPIVSNGHLKHVGQRARKLVRRENATRRIRKVKTTTSPSQINHTTTSGGKYKRGPPGSTKSRPSIGREDEVRTSARVKTNKRGISSKAAKSSKAKRTGNKKLDDSINFSL